jgi:very-short-patch-repair endonuclease
MAGERWEIELRQSIEDSVRPFTDGQYDFIHRAIERYIGSPIERLFAARCAQAVPWIADNAIVLCSPCPFEAIAGRLKAEIEVYRFGFLADAPLIGVFPQVPFGPYVLDFVLGCSSRSLISVGSIVSVAVECDGHDFHERTKEQAAHDRARDREVQSRGLPVFRFTGSELYRNPNACADQALSFVLDRHRAMLAVSENRHASE